jgi:hypothetical protein
MVTERQREEGGEKEGERGGGERERERERMHPHDNMLLSSNLSGYTCTYM